MTEVINSKSLLVAILCVADFMGELEAGIEQQVCDGGGWGLLALVHFLTKSWIWARLERSRRI